MTKQDKLKVIEQNKFLNQWANRLLSQKLDGRSCNHKTVTEISENRFQIYVKCADCHRIIKLRKE